MLLEDFEKILASREREGAAVELKEAKYDFNRNSLMDYCAAIANENGGKLILGVDNRGKVVGTKAFEGTVHEKSNELLQLLRIRIDAEELMHPEGRVVIFHIPRHPTARIIKSKGKFHYPMRAGSSLTEMDEITMRKVLTEVDADFSASVAPGLTIADLDPQAINIMRNLWAAKSRRPEYLKTNDELLLRNLSLLIDEGITYTAVILLAKEETVAKVLPNAEIIFEWRQDDTKTAYDFRTSWRGPFLKFFDDIWRTIDARNLRFPFQEGFVQREIFAFSEKVIREAVLNAVAHRDYSLKGQSIFIKASPQQFYVESPGGFPSNVTEENILRSCSWRNRRLAETLEKAGLVERSGQGIDDIFEKTIRDGKGLPDFIGTSDLCVRLNIPAQVRDKGFIKYLETLAIEKQVDFSLEEILELERIRKEKSVKNTPSKQKFLEMGIIELVGKTRGVKYILSHHYYSLDGREGEHTRIAGITRDAKKELILTHLKKHKQGHSGQFREALPEVLPRDIANMLQELRRDKKIQYIGTKSKGYWQLVP